jgi:outer membrane receptor protein involved in Fe transport
VQPEQDMAIATSVFSGDDLRRAGARTVLEALAWIPGVWVEHINANLWGVTARGDGSSLVAHNTQILRDGREQFAASGWSTTTWTRLNMPIDLVQRIEVQRGAGNTLWGSNAANCVINIVTRAADNGSAGGVDVDSNGRAAANLQWGTRTASGWKTSFWASGSHQPGSSEFVRGRRDWDNQENRAAGAKATLSVEGGAEVSFDVSASTGVGASIFAVARVPNRLELHVAQREFGTRLSIPQARDGRLELAGYVQDADMTTFGGTENHRRTIELSAQDFLRLGSHELLAGGSVNTDSITSRAAALDAVAVPTDTDRLQAFVQDEWRFAENRGSVVLGAQAQTGVPRRLRRQPVRDDAAPALGGHAGPVAVEQPVALGNAGQRHPGPADPVDRSRPALEGQSASSRSTRNGVRAALRTATRCRSRPR